MVIVHKLFVGMSLALLMGCVTPPSASDVPETTINGQKAYVVSAGGAIPNLKGTPTDDDIAAGMARISTGDHGSSLPNRASLICPTGYKVMSNTPPVVRPEGMGVWSMSSKFTIVCT
jgi:hypothetical protein